MVDVVPPDTKSRLCGGVPTGEKTRKREVEAQRAVPNRGAASRVRVAAENWTPSSSQTGLPSSTAGDEATICQHDCTGGDASHGPIGSTKRTLSCTHRSGSGTRNHSPVAVTLCDCMRIECVQSAPSAGAVVKQSK